MNTMMKRMRVPTAEALTSTLRTGVRTSNARQWGWLFEEPPKLPYRAMNFRDSGDEPKRAPEPVRRSLRRLTA